MNNWIEVADILNLPAEGESVLVNVRNSDRKFCFVDVGYWQFDENEKIVWETRLGLEKHELVTHFDIDSIPKPIPFQ